MKIAYEPHPVTPERKAELRGKGLRIVDAQFAPDDADQSEASEKQHRPKPRKKSRDRFGGSE